MIHLGLSVKPGGKIRKNTTFGSLSIGKNVETSALLYNWKPADQMKDKS